jgi:hypothetical protein
MVNLVCERMIGGCGRYFALPVSTGMDARHRAQILESSLRIRDKFDKFPRCRFAKSILENGILAEFGRCLNFCSAEPGSATDRFGDK